MEEVKHVQHLHGMRFLWKFPSIKTLLHSPLAPKPCSLMSIKVRRELTSWPFVYFWPIVFFMIEAMSPFCQTISVNVLSLANLNVNCKKLHKERDDIILYTPNFCPWLFHLLGIQVLVGCWLSSVLCLFKLLHWYWKWCNIVEEHLESSGLIM